MLLITLLIFLLHFSKAQVVNLGGCPNAKPMQNFDATKYLGKWYEYARYFAIFELDGECVTATYSNGENGTVTVKNELKNALLKNHVSISGVATFEEAPTVARLSVVFPSLPVKFPAPYWVLDTDYDSYAVVWSCVHLGLLNSQNAWILTRESIPANETSEKAYDVTKSQNITDLLFRKTNQKDC